MVVAEFLFIAATVGIFTQTWLGFLGTFFGLTVLYRFTPLSALLSLALSLYWGLLGYHLGAATGQFGVGPLLAVVGFAVGAGVHHEGFLRLFARRGEVQPAPHWAREDRLERCPELEPVGPEFGREGAEVIDVEYRVVS